MEAFIKIYIILFALGFKKHKFKEIIIKSNLVFLSNSFAMIFLKVMKTVLKRIPTLVPFAKRKFRITAY